ncbi:MAG TPA: 4-alpha-glucanotransferase [Anaeromyxobacteraceae bacterium]|nr:4-alpha-glucanotransferase [Anaeromyxobacteraceae bacterium]
MRSSGILLHPTSLPSPHGVGDLGEGALRFADWLRAAGQRLWQVLPLAPAGYGDSPYQALSAFAGNPLLVSLDALGREGLLDPADLEAPPFPARAADYGAVIPWKAGRLRLAAERFAARASPARREALAEFRAREKGWLEDLALFLAVKESQGGRAWVEWPADLAGREPDALSAARRALSAEVEAQVFAQFAFREQWAALRGRCRELGLALMGDLPIYLAHDSAEVWARRWLFRLDPAGQPEAVGGVPPDYFSATGQRWGNPLFDWEAHRAEGFGFWVERVRAALSLCDRVRLDHFRGFEAYWEIPAGEPTAERGRWVPGPGAALLEALKRALGALPLVAENLGVITPEVEALRHRFGLPGMAILQFAFGDDPQAPSFRPHTWQRDLVAYSGTHDNDTTLGWWTGEGPGHSTRTPESVARERERARRYLGTDGAEMNWAFIRALGASVADAVVVPLQDALGLGSEARMNVPARELGNWRWRFAEGDCTAEVAARLREVAETYERV